MKKCDSCGKTYSEGKDVFCPHCGAVAQKQCTHGSSFDSSKWNRGEIYRQNNANSQNTTYTPGVEPHAQREKYPYNRFEDTFGDAGRYSDETPGVKVFPDFSKMKKNGKSNIKIGVIITFIIIVANFIVGLIAINENDYNDVYYEVVSEYTDVAETQFYPVASGASISLVGEDGDFKTFELAIYDMYFPYENVNSSSEIKEYILKGGVFPEINICTFSETEISEENYDNALNESYYISSDDSGKAGRYQFTCEFDYDEIVCINGGVSMYLDNGMYVNTELPFNAFSVSENGEVTYYTSYAGDETEWNTVFTECSNENAVDDYSVLITFDDEE